MANPFAVNIESTDGSTRLEGQADFTDAANRPAAAASPTFTGTVTLPAVVVAASLPTVDPAVAGHLWSNAGVVTVSAG